MKICGETHTYDGTGRAGYSPLSPVTTQAHTRAGILKAWTKAAETEYTRKLEFYERYKMAREIDAQAIDGVWIAEGYGSDGARRYRMTAYAEKGGPVICGAYDTREHWHEYAETQKQIKQLLDKYATK